MSEADMKIEAMPTIVKRKIAEIYSHPCPLMFGGTAHSVDVQLNLLHELLFEFQGRQAELTKEWMAERSNVGAEVHWFAGSYIDKNPDAEERVVADHVVSCWKRVSNRLGLSLPILPTLE